MDQALVVERKSIGYNKTDGAKEFSEQLFNEIEGDEKLKKLLTAWIASQVQKKLSTKKIMCTNKERLFVSLGIALPRD